MGLPSSCDVYGVMMVRFKGLLVLAAASVVARLT